MIHDHGLSPAVIGEDRWLAGTGFQLEALLVGEMNYLLCHGLLEEWVHDAQLAEAAVMLEVFGIPEQPAN